MEMYDTYRTFKPGHNSFYKTACAPSEDSDQPAHSRSLVRIFAVCMDPWVPT